MKNIEKFWCWLISFRFYRGVRKNTVVNKELEKPLAFVDLTIAKHEAITSSYLIKKRNKEPKTKS